MNAETMLEKAPELAKDDYLAVGVATCFRREDGELETIHVLEPVPSAYLESVFQGIPTSYQCIFGTTIGAALDHAVLSTVNGIDNVQHCDEYGDRVLAAARTYKSRPAVKDLVPVAETRTDLNYSTEKKRVLNLKNVVKAEDNVRQHEYTHKKL
jgi:hypothetical protein